jgi:hypothetical protein
MQRRGKHASATFERLRLLHGLCRGVMLKKIRAPVELRDVRRTVMTSIQKLEEPSLLGFVTRKRLMKILQRNSHY